MIIISRVSWKLLVSWSTILIKISFFFFFGSPVQKGKFGTQNKYNPDGFIMSKVAKVEEQYRSENLNGILLKFWTHSYFIRGNLNKKNYEWNSL